MESRRVFLEEVNGRPQGAVFRFTQGLEAGINRLVWGPDGALYAGGVGMTGGWSWKGRQFGLQRLEFGETTAFEMLAVRAMPDGVEIEFTKPLAEGAADEIGSYLIQHWRYTATANYGGPKLDQKDLSVGKLTISTDRRKVRLTIPELESGRVLHLLLNEDIRSDGGDVLWTGECWYTMNSISC